MLNNNWYVVTGAPSSGKTTTVNFLKKMGYKVAHETAREYIEGELAKGLTMEEIRRDEKLFQDKIMEMKIETEKNLNKSDVVFLDRGIPDTWVYYRLYGISSDLTLEETMKRCSYKKIFLLDPLRYKLDRVRTESKKEQRKLHELLEEAYQNLNLEVVKIPVLPEEERVKLILSHL